MKFVYVLTDRIAIGASLGKVDNGYTSKDSLELLEAFHDIPTERSRNGRFLFMRNSQNVNEMDYIYILCGLVTIRRFYDLFRPIIRETLQRWAHYFWLTIILLVSLS